jgi:hypothetical protein
MAAINSSIVDQINISDNGMVFYRITTQDDEGQVTYERGALVPGQNLSGLPLELIEQCQATWTPEVVSTYNNSINLGAQ